MQIVFFSRSSYRALFSLAGRCFAYALSLALISFGMMWGAAKYGRSFYDETGLVEISETVFAVCAALVFLLAARMDQSRAPCSILLSTLLFCAVVRESDYFLDVLVGQHAWKVIVTLLLVLLSFYCMRNRRRVEESVVQFMSESSSGVFISGLLVLIVFSRLFGYGGFWKEMLDIGQYKAVKTIVEEGVEMMGYFLILISGVEYRHAALMKLQRGKTQQKEVEFE